MWQGVMSFESSGDVIGVKPLSENSVLLNKEHGWSENADSHSYAWKIMGRNTDSVTVHPVKKVKVEGENSHQFILHNGWGRWIVQMNDKKGQDISSFKAFKFALRSSDAAMWDDFSVFIDDKNGSEVKVLMDDVGFKADGKWHWCTIQIPALKAAGLDISKVEKLFQISWGGGVKSGHEFFLDHLHLVK